MTTRFAKYDKRFLGILFWETLENAPLLIGFLLAIRIRSENVALAFAWLVVGAAFLGQWRLVEQLGYRYCIGSGCWNYTGRCRKLGLEKYNQRQRTRNQYGNIRCLVFIRRPAYLQN